MDAVRALFEEFKTGGIEYVRALKTDEASESYILEFKKLHRDGPSLNDDDKTNLAKTISAFANSSGGVLVWGVSTKGNDDDPEQVKDLHPIRELSRVKSAMESFSSQVVQRPVEGVEFESIEQSDDEGFLVMLIPAVTEGDPVMATAKNQHRYYIRMGTRSMPMEHNQVGAMFARRAVPKLELHVLAGTQSSNKLCVSFGLRNSGRGLARHPAVVFHPGSSDDFNPEKLVWTSKNESIQGGQLVYDVNAGFAPHGKRTSRMFNTFSNPVIYPGLSLYVCDWFKPLPKDDSDVEYRLEFPYEVYCEEYQSSMQFSMGIGRVHGEVWVEKVFMKERNITP